MIRINVAEEFTDSPGGRYKNEGKYSGEEFRETLLIPRFMEAIKKHDILEINMDGCFGYPSSFIDESFGGLARKFTNYKILDYIKIVSNDEPGLIDDIEQCINHA